MNRLQIRLIFAFGFTITITSLISSLLAYSVTSARFETLITDHNQLLASTPARLLEASYAYHGDWRGVTNSLINPTPTASPAWQSQVDYWQITIRLFQTTAHLDDDETATSMEPWLYQEWLEYRSLARVAQLHQVEPSALVSALVLAEQTALTQAIQAGTIPADQQDNLMLEIQAQAVRFVWQKSPFFDATLWKETLAREMGLSVAELQTTSLLDSAAKRGIAPEQLVTAIISAEKERAAEKNLPLDEIEEAMLLEEAHQTVFGQLLQRQPLDSDSPIDYTNSEWVDVGQNWVRHTILMENEWFLVADTTNKVIFDSRSDTDSQQGQALSSAELTQGVPLYDRRQQPPTFLGTVIVDAASDYDKREQADFLANVAYYLTLSSLIAGLLAMGLATWLTQRVLSPIYDLTHAAKKLASGEQTEPLPAANLKDPLGQMSRAFNQMAQALQMQQLLRKRLVNDIAHDLKTPLSVIQLELEAAKDGLQTVDEATVRVHHEISLLQNLMDDLRWLAKTDEGLILLSTEPTNMVELTTQAVERWRSKAQLAAINLSLTLPDEPLPTMHVDATRLNQVLGNLLANAFQHTPANGHITVKLAIDKQQTAAHQPKSTLVTTVTNDGLGIPAADIPHIFERFYRADTSRTKQTGGRGLGLAIVRQIIVMHGGTVSAMSVPAESTTIEYRLPL